MQKHVTILALLGATALLAACGNKTEANEKNFGAALNQYFDEKGEQCLEIRKWLVEVPDPEPRVQGILARRMAALEAAGLVKGTAAESAPALWNIDPYATVKVKRYVLTDAAKPFVQELDGVRSVDRDDASIVKQPDLCWGRKTLDKVVKWQGPMTFVDHQEAIVTYTYKVEHMADWARRPDVQAAFPAIKRILDGAGKEESRHAVKLTSAGWKARGLD